MFLFLSTFERKVNFLGCFLKFPGFAMKNMFWMQDSFAFLATGFNFICSRLKNCLVYQKAYFWCGGGWRSHRLRQKQLRQAKNFEQFILPLEIVNASRIKNRKNGKMMEKN